MGTEIERMDAEMKTLAEEIAMLDTAKWNLNAVIPMKSISNRWFNFFVFTIKAQIYRDIFFDVHSYDSNKRNK